MARMKKFVKKKVLRLLPGGRVRIRDEYGRIRTVKLRPPPNLKQRSGHEVLGALPTGELVYIRSDTGKLAVTSPTLDYQRRAKGSSPPHRRMEGD